MQGTDPVFDGVIEKYGQDMFALVMAAGVAGQAAEAAAALGQHNPKMLHAVGMLAGCFNQVSNALVIAKGWDEALVAQCDRDIQLAFSGKIATADGKIILDS